MALDLSIFRAKIFEIIYAVQVAMKSRDKATVAVQTDPEMLVTEKKKSRAVKRTWHI